MVLKKNWFKKNYYLKFITILTKQGKKAIALKIFFLFLSILKKIFKKNPWLIIRLAILYISPLIKINKRIYYRRVFDKIKICEGSIFALKWLIEASKKQNYKTFVMRLAIEFLEAANKKGFALLKKQNFYKYIIENKGNIYTKRKKRKKNFK